MPIEQSKSSYQKEITLRGGGKFSETIRPWRCRCDYCGKEAYKEGETPGDAADVARKDGFSTIPSKIATHPSKWACATCKEKLDKKQTMVMKAATNIITKKV